MMYRILHTLSCRILAAKQLLVFEIKNILCTGWGSELGDFKINTKNSVIDMCVVQL